MNVRVLGIVGLRDDDRNRGGRGRAKRRSQRWAQRLDTLARNEGAAVSPKIATMMGASVSTPPSPMSPQPSDEPPPGRVKLLPSLHAVKKNRTGRRREAGVRLANALAGATVAPRSLAMSAGWTAAGFLAAGLQQHLPRCP